MNAPLAPATLFSTQAPNPIGGDFPVTVLLVDDQPMIGEAVRRMLMAEPDIKFVYCANPQQAVAIANQVQPTVILQDLVMPEVDGLTLVKLFRANPQTRETPLIVLSTKEEPVIKAESFSLGANDYLVKLPDKVELIARIRHHSKGYINLLQRNEAYNALEASRKLLADELAAGTRYVESLLPRPVDGPLRIDWRYIPCSELAGDTLGYHWLDPDHLAIYLLDVTGHGVASALLSVTVMNVLRSLALPQTDFRQPGPVLTALNDAFQMEHHGDKCFSIWYGIYRRSDRTLEWASGGHPSALLYPGDRSAPATPVQLASTGPMVGITNTMPFATGRCPIEEGARLYVFSDGAFEIIKPDGTLWHWAEFVEFMSQAVHDSDSPLDRLLAHIRTLRGSETLDDDVSILELTFGAG